MVTYLASRVKTIVVAVSEWAKQRAEGKNKHVWTMFMVYIFVFLPNILSFSNPCGSHCTNTSLIALVKGIEESALSDRGVMSQL